MSEQKLKPCPFCGGKAEFEVTVTENAVRCTLCRAKIVRSNRKSKASETSSIQFWNARLTAELEAAKAEIERLREERRQIARHHNEMCTCLAIL
jgi:hypothetical protein